MKFPPILGLMPAVDADYYALLQVAPSADATTIRMAWAVEQRLWGVRQNAPDLATRHAAERHVLLLGQVKDVLLDPRRRANYDRERALRAASAATTAPALPVRGAAIPSLRSSTTLVKSGPKHRPGDGALQGAMSTTTSRREADGRRGLAMPLALGLAGAVITGTQIFHWDLASLMGAIAWLRALVET